MRLASQTRGSWSNEAVSRRQPLGRKRRLATFVGRQLQRLLPQAEVPRSDRPNAARGGQLGWRC
jgi:hypothetical protein